MLFRLARLTNVSLYVLPCPFMSLYVSVCLPVSLYVPSCPFMSLYVPLCPFMSLYVPLCPLMSLCVSLCPFIALYVSLCFLMYLCVSLCPFVYHYVSVCLYMSLCVSLCRFMSRCVSVCPFMYLPRLQLCISCPPSAPARVLPSALPWRSSQPALRHTDATANATNTTMVHPAIADKHKGAGRRVARWVAGGSQPGSRRSRYSSRCYLRAARGYLRANSPTPSGRPRPHPHHDGDNASDDDADDDGSLLAVRACIRLCVSRRLAHIGPAVSERCW